MVCSIAVVVSTATCSLRYSTGNFCPWYFYPGIFRLRRSTRKFYHGDFIQVFVDFVVPLVGGGGWGDRIGNFGMTFRGFVDFVAGSTGIVFFSWGIRVDFSRNLQASLLHWSFFRTGGNSGHFQKSQQRQGQINEKGDQRKKHHTVDGIPSTGPE